MFAKLPKGTVDQLLEPENKVEQTGVPIYRVRKFNVKEVMAQLRKLVPE